MGKAIEPPHPRKDPQYKAKEPLELVHTDIAGPFRPRAIEGGSLYNLVIIDDYGRKSWTVPLREKSDVRGKLMDWIAIQENQVGRKVKNMRLANGGEYIDEDDDNQLKLVVVCDLDSVNISGRQTHT